MPNDSSKITTFEFIESNLFFIFFWKQNIQGVHDYSVCPNKFINASTVDTIFIGKSSGNASSESFPEIKKDPYFRI